MYQGNNSNSNRSGGSGRSFSRPSFSNSRPGSRPPFRGGNSGGNRPFRGGGRGAPKGSSIDISKFVNKAVQTDVPEVPFVPQHRFADFGFDARILANLATKGYVNPSPIQDRSIPHVMQGQDVVGIANTGTGKTAAFLLPLVNKAIIDKGLRVLIMVPTRELAQQIAVELSDFSRGLGIYSAVCVGGAGIVPQIRSLQRRPQFVIGTPGRLKDLLERKSLNLSDFRVAVLDEADRMLDMGFIHDMRTILALLPSPRHTLFFSATLSTDIEKLIGAFLRDPVRISVKTRDTSAQIDQDIVRVPAGKNKLDILHDMLTKPEFDKVLVFGRTKHGVERLSKTLGERGFKSASIHGNKTQSHRQKALDLFKRDHVQVLVATDVAARGLDIADVSHVINYDMPTSHEDYIHRIGRTGRAGKKGKALTFID